MPRSSHRDAASPALRGVGGHLEDTPRKGARGLSDLPTRGKPQVVGIDPEAPGLVQILVPLGQAPDSEWCAIFAGPPPGYGYSLGRHSPALFHDRIELRAPPEDVGDYIRDLDARMAATNAEYERTVRPRKDAERQRRDELAGEERRRIEEAQRQIDELE